MLLTASVVSVNCVHRTIPSPWIHELIHCIISFLTHILWRPTPLTLIIFSKANQSMNTSQSETHKAGVVRPFSDYCCFIIGNNGPSEQWGSTSYQKCHSSADWSKAVALRAVHPSYTSGMSHVSEVKLHVISYVETNIFKGALQQSYTWTHHEEKSLAC